MSKLLIVKVSKNAYTPVRSSEKAAGVDLMSAYDYIIPAHGSCLVSTDLKIRCPEGTYGQIYSRSGLALKNKIVAEGGVLDADFNGCVSLILFNHSENDFEVKSGFRMAQLVIHKIEYPIVHEVKSLDATERNESGFGSSGIM